MHQMTNQKTPVIKWSWMTFNRLGVINCYKVMQLRAAVFIEEQGYRYNDLDDKDQNALHLLGFHQNNKTLLGKRKGSKLIACARLMRVDDNTLEIGRVTVHEQFRKNGVGSALLNKLTKKIDAEYKNHTTILTIGIDKNCQHLPHFYKKFGFDFKNTIPTIQSQYSYKHFSFPSLEMVRPPQVCHRAKIGRNKIISFFKHSKNTASSFFSSQQEKEGVSQTQLLQPTPKI